MAAKIKKGDTVIVIAGRDKGRTGEVIEMRRDDGRALVRGVNMVKRHQKQSASQEGGIISKEAPIHLSNIALADPKDGKPTRVGFKLSARATIARKCASPSVRESRSMADTEDKQAKKPDNAAAAERRTDQPKPPRKSKKAAKQARGRQGGKADAKAGKPAGGRASPSRACRRG